jgi:hypothetical protein
LQAVVTFPPKEFGHSKRKLICLTGDARVLVLRTNG